MKWMAPWAVAVWLGLAAGVTVRAETWTNVAGHVITAKLLSVEGEQVLLQDTHNRILHVPLTSLKPADQARARAQTQTEPLPAGLQVPFEQAQQDIHRAGQFLQGGRITREQFVARCQIIEQRFEYFGLQALQRGDGPTNREILEQLKRRLDRAQEAAGVIANSPRKPDDPPNLRGHSA